MKKTNIVLSFIFALIYLNSCDITNQNKKVNRSFGIYFLDDTLLTEHDIVNTDIDSLILSSEPWLTHNDIDFYDFSTHCIYLKKDKSYFFKNYGGEYYMFSPLLISQPFVTVSETKRCYIGALHSAGRSAAPVVPYIDEMDVGAYPDDVIHISRVGSNDEDIRNNPEIMETLIEQDIFHAGLEIELKSVQLLNNSDTSTVEYLIEIKNNDQDNLYVIDPEKTGSKLFHYFTNGPYLQYYSEHSHLYSQYKEVYILEPYDSWNVEWFSLIESNHSIQRTIILKGYPYIPDGNYTSYMYFSSPKLIDKENRYISDGRIWIGRIRSNDIEVEIQN